MVADSSSTEQGPSCPTGETKRGSGEGSCIGPSELANGALSLDFMAAVSKVWGKKSEEEVERMVVASSVGYWRKVVAGPAATFLAPRRTFGVEGATAAAR